MHIINKTSAFCSLKKKKCFVLSESPALAWFKNYNTWEQIIKEEKNIILPVFKKEWGGGVFDSLEYMSSSILPLSIGRFR